MVLRAGPLQAAILDLPGGNISPAGDPVSRSARLERKAESPESLNRRDFLSYCSGVGLVGTLLPGILWARRQEGQEDPRTASAGAEKVAGLESPDEEREAMVRGLNRHLESYRELRTRPISDELPPAMHFGPVFPFRKLLGKDRPFRPSRVPAPATPSLLGLIRPVRRPGGSGAMLSDGSRARFPFRTRRPGCPPRLRGRS